MNIKQKILSKLSIGQTVNEVLRNNQIADNPKFIKWKKQFNAYLQNMIDELQSDYLNELNLRIKINYDYVFNGGKSIWLASYERRSRQIEQGVISIGINYPLFYKEMCKRNIDTNKFNIEAQARITIGHEVGHGLVDYIKQLNISSDILSKSPNLSIIKHCSIKKEEILVEEFGEWCFPYATDTWSSVLADALEELKNI